MPDATGWGPDTWARLRAAVGAEVERASVVRRVLPVRATASDKTTVSRGEWDFGQLRARQDETIPIVELTADFRLTEQQVKAEPENGDAESLARLVARRLALTEEEIVFHGYDVEGSTGLLTKAGFEEVSFLDRSQRPQYGFKTVEAIDKALSNLEHKGFPGPFLLVLRPEEVADLRTRPASGLRSAAIDILPPDIVRIESSRGLSAKTGFVLALGGSPVELISTADAYAVEFVQVDPDGFYVFRLRTRFAVRIRSDASVLKLAFEV